MKPRLLIVDDDPEITSALARGLMLHGYEVLVANHADVALTRLQNEPLDGAIIDVMLGDDSGLELVRQARAAAVTLPILMLSALSEVEDRTAGLVAGADDYVVKPFAFDELVARLKVQAHRVAQTRPDPAVLHRKDRRLSLSAGSAGEVSLTERECDLLLHLAAQPGTPIARAALFQALWIGEGSSNENVVDVYIGYLRKKLKTADFGIEIKTIRHQGFCLMGRIQLRD